MNEDGVQRISRLLTTVLLVSLAPTASAITADEIEDKLSPSPDLPSPEQALHDEEVGAVRAYLQRRGSLINFAGAERILAEHPELASLATAGAPATPEAISVGPPGIARMSVAGETSGTTSTYGFAALHGHNGVDREGFLSWRADGFFDSSTAAVLGRHSIDDSSVLAGALGVLYAGITPVGAVGQTYYEAETSYGLYGLATKPLGIALYAEHEAGEEEAAGQALYASGNHTTPLGETPDQHAALIENRASEFPSVLALRMAGETSNDLTTADNFVTFFTRNAANTADVAVGAIEGNGSSGIQLNTSGADLAEYLERLDPRETLQAGEVVGVVGGKVTRATLGAQRVMVVSSGAAVAANSPGQDKASNHSLIAFVGQVAVRVRGPVRAGDLIVASGLGDGYGRAVPPEHMAPADYHLLVGQAWETSPDEDQRLVKAVVGLGTGEAFLALQHTFEARLAEKDTLLERLEAQVHVLTRRLDSLDRHALLTASR